MAEFVYTCLREAEHRQLTSVAFPSLGTGNLKYPVDNVAKIMFQTVGRYSLESKIGCLKEVYFVIYERDKEALQVYCFVEIIYQFFVTPVRSLNCVSVVSDVIYNGHLRNVELSQK